MSGVLNMGGHKMTGLPTVTPHDPLVTLPAGQVSKAVSYAMTKTDTVHMGQLHMANKRYVDARNAVIKTYVDKQDAFIRATHVFLAGDTMTGDLTIGGHKVTGPLKNTQESDSDAGSVAKVTQQRMIRCPQDPCTSQQAIRLCCPDGCRQHELVPA